MKRFLPIAAAMACLLTARAEGPDVTLDEVFAKVDARALTVKDLKAEFRQTKKMPSRKRPLVGTGLVSVQKSDAGTRLCWESWELDEKSGEKSYPQRLLVLGDQKLMISWDLTEKTGERTDLGKGKLEVSEFLTIGGSLSGLKKSFTVTLKSGPKDGAGYVLSLTPTSERLQRLIRTLEIEVDPAEWVVSRIRVSDTLDAETDIALSKMVVNGGVDEALFTVPAEVKLTDVQLDK